MNELVVKSYWRSIQRGARTLADVPPELRDRVRELARQAGREDLCVEQSGGGEAS